MGEVFTIPEWNKEKFNKYIKSLNRKGLNVNVNDLGPTLETVDDVDYICHKYEVENNIKYAVPGWKFVGTIEHKTNGNIIRNISGEAVPKYFYTAPCKCDHCNTIRNRVDTFLVKNDNGEFKQVGRSCLKSYTGLNPALCVYAMDLSAEIAKMEIDPEEVALGGFNSFGSFRGYDGDLIKKISYAEIKAHGYIKATEFNNNGNVIKSTKDTVVDLYIANKRPDVTDDEIKAIDEWVKTLDTQHNDYFQNAVTAWNEEYLESRDIALVASLISCYFKAIAKEAERKARAELRAKETSIAMQSGYAGEVGEKIEFEVASDRVLFVNEPYAYGANYTYTHRIVTTKGFIIIWTTDIKDAWIDPKTYEVSKKIMADKIGVGRAFVPGLKVKATVKAHKDYKGEPQTVVTRGKVIL